MKTIVNMIGLVLAAALLITAVGLFLAAMNLFLQGFVASGFVTLVVYIAVIISIRMAWRYMYKWGDTE